MGWRKPVDSCGGFLYEIEYTLTLLVEHGVSASSISLDWCLRVWSVLCRSLQFMKSKMGAGSNTTAVTVPAPAQWERQVLTFSRAYQTAPPRPLTPVIACPYYAPTSVGRALWNDGRCLSVCPFVRLSVVCLDLNWERKGLGSPKLAG